MTIYQALDLTKLQKKKTERKTKLMKTVGFFLLQLCLYEIKFIKATTLNRRKECEHRKHIRFVFLKISRVDKMSIDCASL